MSFYTALTGLQAATSQLAVTSNNIANVGTTGFKRSRADFGDIFATSPLQKASATVGQGVALKQVTQEFSQGNIQFSANSLDIAITGDGFFPLKSADGLQDIYTRNGTFLLDESFNVVNSAGQSLIAASVDSSGKADLDKLSKLQIPRQTTGDAIETTKITLGLNFPADAQIITKPFDKNDPTTYNKTTAVTVYDAGGNNYLATVYYAKTQVASPDDQSNKWQTYVYIGDTKLQEMLIQSKDKAGPLYVNKYGQVKPESQIPPELIARGITKLTNLDDLKNPISSLPAKVASDQLAAPLNEKWKSGLNVYDQIQTMSNLGGVVQKIKIEKSAEKNGTLLITLPTAANPNQTPISVSVTAGMSPAEIAQAIKTALLAEEPTGANFAGTNGRQLVETGDGTLLISYAKSDGDITLPDPADATKTIDDVVKVADLLADPTLGTGVISKQEKLFGRDQLAFAINIDGSDKEQIIDLSSLYDSSVDKVFTGVEIARALTNAINKSYGDERFFDFTQGVLVTNDVAPVINLRMVNSDGSEPADNTLSISFAQDVTLGDDADKMGLYAGDGTGKFRYLDRITVDQALKAMQYQIDKKAEGDATVTPVVAANDAFKDLKVSYDLASQQFTFTKSDKSKIYVSTDRIDKGLMGLSTSEKLCDPLTGEYGEKVIANGGTLLDKDQQRYGSVVTFDDNTRTFIVSSGTTGDTSSVKMLAASSYARALFGMIPAKEDTSALPKRGIISEPAVLNGKTIGLNLDNKIKVDEQNNQFVVTVDNVTGLIQIPPSRDYTIESFRQTLEDRINALADNYGRTVSGVKVSINTDAIGNKFFQITSGTAGNNSFLKVTANSIWGLDNLDSVRGSTSVWLDPKQARNSEGFPLYVDRDGMETTDPEDFSEDETRDLWSPIFYDKGELTFNTRGDLISPMQQIDFKSTTIGKSGTTLKFSIDYGSSTQYSSPFSIRKQDQNGRPEGDLIGVDIADNGLVNASYSNGTTKSLAKIILANFAAPTGLRQIGDASFYATSKSGQAKYGEAGAAGFGTIRAGARERANVDLTNELVELITAQRAFQANAKAIETNNTLTQAIINIRS